MGLTLRGMPRAIEAWDIVSGQPTRPPDQGIMSPLLYPIEPRARIHRRAEPTPSRKITSNNALSLFMAQLSSGYHAVSGNIPAMRGMNPLFCDGGLRLSGEWRHHDR